MMEFELYSHYEPVSDCVLPTSNVSLTSEYQCLIDEKAISSWEIELIYVCIWRSVTDREILLTGTLSNIQGHVGGRAETKFLTHHAIIKGE
jgi:hypothetical protein